METTPNNLGPDALFERWKLLLQQNQLLTAAELAGSERAALDTLQQQINNYFDIESSKFQRSLSLEQTPDEKTIQFPEIPGLEVLGVLGKGGMGFVFRVRDRLGREFALKQARSQSELGKERFFSEAWAMARFEHPHIVPVHEFKEHLGISYIQMPIYSSSLQHRLGEYQSDLDKSIALMSKIADALGYLHARGYIHRDLKPLNILLDADDQPAISDFGLVKNLSDDSLEVPLLSLQKSMGSTGNSSRTRAGSVLGTRAYMPPAQAAGLTHLANPTWDIHALGVMLYQLVVGRMPDFCDHPERRLDPASQELRSLVPVKTDVDPQLDRIIVKCLATRDEDRYADGRLLAKELSEWVAQRSRARETSVSIPKIIPNSKSSRSRIRYWKVVIPLTIVALLTAFFLYRPKPTDANSDPWGDFRNQLSSKETVVIVGETGLPALSRSAYGDAYQPTINANNSTMKIDTTRRVMLELLDELPIEGYRFEFEYFQEVAGGSWHVGGYVGRRPVASNYPNSNMCCLFTANDFSIDDQGKNFGSYTTSYEGFCNGSEGGKHFSRGLETTAYPVPKDWSTRGWHKLAVEVSPLDTQWIFDGKPTEKIANRPTGTMNKMLRGFMPFGTDETLRLSANGGLGLYVACANATFRNIRIIPRE